MVLLLYTRRIFLISGRHSTGVLGHFSGKGEPRYALDLTREVMELPKCPKDQEQQYVYDGLVSGHSSTTSYAKGNDTSCRANVNTSSSARLGEECTYGHSRATHFLYDNRRPSRCARAALGLLSGCNSFAARTYASRGLFLLCLLHTPLLPALIGQLLLMRR